MEIDHLPNGAEALEEARLKHTMIAQLIALVAVVLLFSYPMIREIFRFDEETEQLHVKVKKVVNYSELSAPPPIDLERVEPKILNNPPKIKTVKFLQPVAKKDEEVEDDEILPSMEDMSRAQISDFDQDGIDSIVVTPEETIEIVPETEEIYSFVQKMPEFPEGGEAALFQYLRDELDYPEIAKDAGIQGTVIVGFIIEMNGEISNVQILRSVHSTLDKEASRVVEKMPKWTPGEQNGRMVRVKFTLPIRFSLKD